MKRLFTACGLLLCVQLAACSPPFAIFEDVGTDPHPPKIKLVGVAYQPPKPAEGEIAPAPDLQPGEGFVVRPLVENEGTLFFRVEYSDVGGDVESFVIRDRDGNLNQDIVPSVPADNPDVDAPTFFSGTKGVADLQDVQITATMLGKHRIELWAVDSHESRSEKVTFTIEIAL